LSEGIYETTCDKCGHAFKFRSGSAKPKPKAAPITDVSSISFTLNGENVTVENPDPSMTFNEWLRTIKGLKVCIFTVNQILSIKGTKRSCGEGGCGACVVMISRFDSSTHKTTNISVNSVHPHSILL
jgi:xanthine dehydrogenase iron-sulfur cluster and FAD-binding subunit A